MRDLRSLVLALFPCCYPSKIRCRPSSIFLIVLGILLAQGSGRKEGYAQSIPVLPPLAPASIDADDLIQNDNDIEENDRVTDIDSNTVESTSVDADIDAVEEAPQLDELLDEAPLGTGLDETLDTDLNESGTEDLEVLDLPGETGVEDAEVLDLPDESGMEDVGGLELPDESGVEGSEVLELPDEVEVEDLEVEVETLDVDVLDRDEPSNDSLNGIEDLLPIQGRERGDPIPTQVDTFKPRQGASIFENVVLTPNAMANPTTLRGISGGPLTASRVAGRTDTATGICTGFVDRNPDHRIELTEFFDYLNLQVESPEDTVLVVRGPGGSWCNDDVVGFNPGLAGEWFSGVYDVWVGSYNEQTYHPYVIRLTDAQ